MWSLVTKLWVMRSLYLNWSVRLPEQPCWQPIVWERSFKPLSRVCFMLTGHMRKEPAVFPAWMFLRLLTVVTLVRNFCQEVWRHWRCGVASAEAWVAAGSCYGPLLPGCAGRPPWCGPHTCVLTLGMWQDLIPMIYVRPPRGDIIGYSLYLISILWGTFWNYECSSSNLYLHWFFFVFFFFSVYWWVLSVYYYGDCQVKLFGKLLFILNLFIVPKNFLFFP